MASPNDRVSRLFDLAILYLIVLNVIVIVIESTEPVGRTDGLPAFYYYFEVVSVAIFSVEYLLRVWCCVQDPRFAGPIAGRLRFMLTPMALIDLLAVLPFYLTALGFIAPDLRVMRALRLFRLFRLLKLGRYSTAMQTLGRACYARRGELISSLFVILILLLVSSSIMYFVESPSETFSSIPAAMWWGIATLTTVGYGDYVPTSDVGKVIGGVIAVLGIGVFALPAGILAGALHPSMVPAEAASAAAPRHRCPHCGEALD